MPDSNSFTRSQPQGKRALCDQALKGRHNVGIPPFQGCSSSQTLTQG